MDCSDSQIYGQNYKYGPHRMEMSGNTFSGNKKRPSTVFQLSNIFTPGKQSLSNIVSQYFQHSYEPGFIIWKSRDIKIEIPNSKKLMWNTRSFILNRMIIDRAVTVGITRLQLFLNEKKSIWFTELSQPLF